MGTGTDRTDRSIRADFPGGFPGDAVDAFSPQGRTGNAATVFNFTRDLLHFRQDHAALRRGTLTELLVNKDQYAYLRGTPDERVLVVLNRAGAGQALTLDVDDLGFRDGLRFVPFAAGPPELSVAAGRLTIAAPKEVNIYWAKSN
jgi:glycosidase